MCINTYNSLNPYSEHLSLPKSDKSSFINMPSRKQVPTLLNLCLSAVSKHCEQNDTPFPALPNQILDAVVNRQELSSNLSQTQLSKIVDKYTDHLEMAVHRFTDHLDFHLQPHHLTQRGIELICQTTCHNLTHLNLSECSVPVEDLTRLPKSIPSIKYLHLRATSADDDVLLNLGKYCFNLRELDISDCDVTDTGITGLCTNGGKCLRINSLEVTGTLITDEGAITIIRNLPHLKIFDYQNMFHVLGNLKTKMAVNLEHIYQSDIYEVSISNATIESAVTLCPNVNAITLLGVKNTDNWVTRLHLFPGLTTLILIRSLLDDAATFEGNIESLLKNIGNNLDTLFCYGIKNVNLLRVGINCNKLRHLELMMCDGFETSTVPYVSNKVDKIFAELRNVQIFCVKEKDVPSAELEFLLSNCRRLEIIHLDECQTLTDDLLRRVWERNSFADLRNFSISRCNSVRMSSLFSFISKCKSLKRLKYWKCSKIENSDHEKLHDLVRNQNLDLFIPKHM